MVSAKPMKNSDERLLISVIKQYYELGMSQEEIAAKEYISKSTISRLINKAIKKGYVKIKMAYPILTARELEEKLMELYGLESATVVPVYVEDQDLCVLDACKALLLDLKKLLRDGDVIGISWGRTMEYFVKMLDDYYNNRKGIKIVQLNGNVASNILSVKAYDIVEKFQSAFSATGYLFPLPILVDDRETARALLNDSRIKPIIDIARQADVAILSVGKLSKKSLIFERGVLNEQDYEELSRAGAVGDICSRYFDAAGNIVDNDLNARVLGLTLEELKRIKNRMVIAVGEDKVHAILGALRTGVINKLYIDERTAAKVIHLSEA